MEQWGKDARREPVITDLDALVAKDHLLRKIERVMDYEWLYKRLSPYYCHDNGRPGTDPVVLIKMVLIQHLYGISSLRQTYERINDTLSYRWFLGYGLLDEIPHFATVSYAFCKRFPPELAEEIFAHILNKAINNRMVEPSAIFIDGTHIKASANKKKFRKEQVAKTAKIYLVIQLSQPENKEICFHTPHFGKNRAHFVGTRHDSPVVSGNLSSSGSVVPGPYAHFLSFQHGLVNWTINKIYEQQLREEVNAEREKLGKKRIEDEDDDDKDGSSGGETVEKTVSTTDPESGMFVKGEHERQFAYEAHTACDKHGVVLAVEVTAGNIHDSVAWDAVYDTVTARFPETGKFIVMDAGYKTPWIAKKTLEKHDIPILPYTRHKGKEGRFRPWEYEYDPANDCYICPLGGMLRHTTTDRDGKRTYRSIPKECVTCHIKAKCGANEKGQKLYTSHIWQEHLDLVEALRKTERGKELYAKRKETIERVFADAKEKHAMRYTHHRGLARVTNWVRLKYAAMNLKKIANWSWNNSFFSYFSAIVAPFQTRTPYFAMAK